MKKVLLFLCIASVVILSSCGVDQSASLAVYYNLLTVTEPSLVVTVDGESKTINAGIDQTWIINWNAALGEDKTVTISVSSIGYSKDVVLSNTSIKRTEIVP